MRYIITEKQSHRFLTPNVNMLSSFCLKNNLLIHIVLNLYNASILNVFGNII